MTNTKAWNLNKVCVINVVREHLNVEPSCAIMQWRSNEWCLTVHQEALHSQCKVTIILYWVFGVGVFSWWGLGPAVWGHLGFLGWGFLYKHKRITLGKKMVLQYLVSIDKVFLYIVCMCHHSNYHRNCSLIRCDAMRCGNTSRPIYIFSIPWNRPKYDSCFGMGF